MSRDVPAPLAQSERNRPSGGLSARSAGSIRGTPYPASTRIRGVFGRTLDRLLKEEMSFRAQLLASLEHVWEREGVFGDSDLQRSVSPLAAVVLERAYPSREQIVPMLKELRTELTGTREQLWQDENIALWGTHLEARKAEKRWKTAFDEIERRFGKGEGLLDLRRAANCGETLGKVADKPTSYAAWAQALLTLPLEAAQRMLSRLPVIEVHRAMKDLPAPNRLRSAVNRLFKD
jgi:hypothetical protein